MKRQGRPYIGVHISAVPRVRRERSRHATCDVGPNFRDRRRHRRFPTIPEVILMESIILAAVYVLGSRQLFV